MMRGRFMNRIKKLLPYLMVNVICFYLLTMLVKDTSKGMFIFFYGINIINFVKAINCGNKKSF